MTQESTRMEFSVDGPPNLDLVAARRWLLKLHNHYHGHHLQIVSTGQWAGHSFTVIDEAIEYIYWLDSTSKPEGIYARVTPLRDAPPAGERGGADLASGIYGMWADIDIAGPGHKTAGLDLPLPANEWQAADIVEHAGLPMPSAWIHSGGGLYPWWLLRHPAEIGHPTDLQAMKALAAGWQQTLHLAARDLGYHYGAGVGDLSRVLRIPGTINRKAGLLRPCKLTVSGGPEYDLDALIEALGVAQDKLPDAPTLAGAAGPIAHTRQLPGQLTPNDDFEAAVDWADNQLLGGLGWKEIRRGDRGERRWLHPEATSELSATTTMPGERDRLWVFSESTVFPAGESITKAHAYALINGLDASGATRALRAAGYGDPLPRTEDMLADLVGEAPAPPVSGEVQAPKAWDINDYPLTDTGMAHAVWDRHSDAIRYCPERGKWLVWNIARWEWDDRGRVRNLVAQTCATLNPQDPTGLRWWKYTQSTAGIAAIARRAGDQAALSITELDRQPWVLNTPSGLVDLRTGQIEDNQPGQHCARITHVGCRNEPSPRWTKFLDDTFGKDADVQSYVQRLIGLSASGQPGEQILPFVYGAGANGKSVFMEVVQRVLGDYASSASSRMLMRQTFHGHETEIARLAGARLVVLSELNDGERFDEAQVKLLTGGDRLSARYMRMDHFNFDPTHQLWLVGNHRPQVGVGGEAFWRRVRLIPFRRTVAAEDRVPDLARILVAEEGPAILKWIVDGAVDYATGGLREPITVTHATEEYAKSEDSVGRFYAECCRPGGGEHVRIQVRHFREQYEQWCREEGDPPVSAKRLSMELVRLYGVGLVKSNGVRYYTNIHLMVGNPPDWRDGM